MQVYTKDSGKNEFRHFLDNQQYQTNGILRYERIFGQGYVSTGGFETTKVCFATVPAVCAVLLAIVCIVQLAVYPVSALVFAVSAGHAQYIFCVPVMIAQKNMTERKRHTQQMQQGQAKHSMHCRSAHALLCVQYIYCAVQCAGPIALV